MADKLPFEEPLRRAVDANIKYYEALGRVTQEYWKSMFGIWRELPVRFGPPQPARPSAPAAPVSNPTSSATAPTLVLEAETGGEAQGVFLVENRLTRVVSTAVVVSAFADPAGRAVQPTLRVEPGVITLPPGGRALVQIYATIDDSLDADVPYRGEVNVPGLSESGIPVLLRRRANRGGTVAWEETRSPAAGRKRASSKQPAAGKSAAAKRQRGSRSPKKRGES
jgi:hypothetical protein